VEAKRQATLDAGLAQATAYMIGIQQHRINLSHPKRIVDTIYGMVSDGINWQFLHLDGNKLRISRRYLSAGEDDRRCIYRFVDAIINAAIASTPQMSPASRFPATKQLWQRDVESTIFGSVPRKLEELLQMPDKEFLVDDSDDMGDLAGVEQFEIVRPEPSRVKVNGSSY